MAITKALFLAMAAMIRPAAAILGGLPASSSKYPYVVNLYNHPNITHQHPSCTGILIREEVILTAASCVHFMNATDGRVVIGDSRNLSNAHVYPWDTFAYPGVYNYRTYKHDIAVITFRGKHNVTTFPKLSKSKVHKGDKVTMVGFGPGLGRHNRHSLRQATVPAIDHDTCQMQMHGIIPVEDDKSCCDSGCAGTNAGTSFQADTGAPVLRDDTVMGIVSVAANHRFHCHPRAFTNMYSHITFIGQFYNRLEEAKKARNGASHNGPSQRVSKAGTKNRGGQKNHTGEAQPQTEEWEIIWG